MAFLITFSVLLAGAAVWMGLFLAFGEADSAILNDIAEWLSPLRVSGWVAYIAICAACVAPFLRRFLRAVRRAPRDAEGD